MPKDATVPVERRRTLQADDATRAVQLGAAVLLGGGFYYGYTKQQRVAEKVRQTDARRAAQGIKPREPVVRASRPPTLFEKQLGLDRPRSAGSAAFRALVGGTIASLTGATVIILGVGAALGATNPTEFRDRMEDFLPPLRKNVTDSLGIKPKPVESEFGSEEAELDHLSQIFETAMREDLEAERRKQQQISATTDTNSRQ